jgi:hypothetical protein
MAFRNRIRLPFYLTRPQFPDDKNVTRLADGSSRVNSITIRKVYEGETEYLPEWVHQRLKIALAHDIVTVEGDRYIGLVTPEGDYDIDWQKFMDYPLAKADFKAQVTPFDATNSNCQSCDEANQILLVDDTFGSTLVENTTYTLNVFTNDTIGCSPFTVTVLTYNTDYLSAPPTISDVGLLSLHTKASFGSANGMKLLTYRVTCPNGSFDEADVFANLDGGVDACLAPLSLVVADVGADTATINFTAPTPAPAGGYEWILGNADTHALVKTKNDQSTTSILLEDLPAATNYTLSIRSKCGDGDYSGYVNINFTTESPESTCGKYRVGANQNPLFGVRSITYINCAGDITSFGIVGYATREICVLETSPRTPVQIIGAGLIEYHGPC